MLKKTIDIKGRTLGRGRPAYIVAELSGNHNQDLSLALRTIQAMKDAGADAVKIQTYKPGSITLDLDQPLFQARQDSPWAGQKLFDVYKVAATPYEWHPKLKQASEDLGMDFFSSPFDLEGVDLLDDLSVPAYKVASLEITDLPLIKHMASKGKPMIISTGIANEEDIRRALAACRAMGNDQIALLKCTSAYPTPMEEVNLRAIPYLEEQFGVLIGLSDHTMGDTVPVAAVTLGAAIVEKHFILDRDMGGVDSSFSMNPEEFGTMVRKIRDVEQALGHERYEVTSRMEKGRKFSRSLFVVQPIQMGEAFTPENVRAIRPGAGIHPRFYEQVLGQHAKSDLAPGTPLAPEHLEEPLD